MSSNSLGYWNFEDYEACFAKIKEYQNINTPIVLILNTNPIMSGYYLEKDSLNPVLIYEKHYKGDEINKFVDRVLNEIKMAKLTHRHPKFII